MWGAAKQRLSNPCLVRPMNRVDCVVHRHPRYPQIYAYLWFWIVVTATVACVAPVVGASEAGE